MELYNSLTSKVGDFEDRMATILQKTWRGFMSRKFKFNYEGLQCWLEQVKHENCHVQHKLYEFKVESEENYARCKQDHWDYVRSRLHHLLRTQNIPGVFSCIHSNELSQLEKCLKNVKYFPKARLSEMNSANQQLEKKRKKLLLQNKLNKTNLRKTWRSLNTMPPVLDDSYPKCLEYHHSKKDCMNFPKSNNSKRKVETTSCNGLSAGSDLNDRLWRERIMMLEKARTPCMLSPKQFLTSYRPNTQSRFATHNKVNRN
ncbi:uncharacterized protein LOC103517962 [Diaphorina citri]|uniref:Uncharacterized protein LOC103517962 n=1 Tax=Diaphorina citri TaxID=121845 RepID=A0A1S4ELS3_DIACI|nr:uncharacterized protein LOC103517962 [Diaphorina citri]